MKISVVIPTYRRAPLLKRCLEALVNQSIPKDSYEIVVVSDGPDHETFLCIFDVQQQFPECPSIRFFSLPEKKGPAAARNKGWQMATANLVVFTDDDCIPMFFFLEAYLDAYEAGNSEWQAFTGTVHVPIPEYPTDHEKNTAHLERAAFVTANCACTRRALQRINGFDEDFKMAWREDSALEFELLRAGI